MAVEIKQFVRRSGKCRGTGHGAVESSGIYLVTDAEEPERCFGRIVCSAVAAYACLEGAMVERLRRIGIFNRAEIGHAQAVVAICRLGRKHEAALENMSVVTTQRDSVVALRRLGVVTAYAVPRRALEPCRDIEPVGIAVQDLVTDPGPEIVCREVTEPRIASGSGGHGHTGIDPLYGIGGRRGEIGGHGIV